jgi:hypothetical protein
MPNFAPQQLYQQQSIQSLNTQTPISHNNPMLNQSYSNSPAQQKQQAEFHAYDTSLQTPPIATQHDPTFLAQQQHYPHDENQMARVDEEAAYLLQQQASSSTAHNQIPSAAQHHTVHLQHQQPQFSLTAEVCLSQKGSESKFCVFRIILVTNIKSAIRWAIACTLRLHLPPTPQHPMRRLLRE